MDLFPDFEGAQLTMTEGLCPNCGTGVPRVLTLKGERASDVYSCGHCGLFAYSTRGVELPWAVPDVRPFGPNV